MTWVGAPSTLVEIEENTHTVIASEGISTLGATISTRFWPSLRSDVKLYSLDVSELFRLDEECRRQRRRCIQTLGGLSWTWMGCVKVWEQATVAVADFYHRCRHYARTDFSDTRRLTPRQRGSCALHNRRRKRATAGGLRFARGIRPQSEA